jgi:hypothetical protein
MRLCLGLRKYTRLVRNGDEKSTYLNFLARMMPSTCSKRENKEEEELS